MMHKMIIMTNIKRMGGLPKMRVEECHHNLWLKNYRGIDFKCFLRKTDLYSSFNLNTIKSLHFNFHIEDVESVPAPI